MVRCLLRFSPLASLSLSLLYVIGCQSLTCYAEHARFYLVEDHPTLLLEVLVPLALDLHDEVGDALDEALLLRLVQHAADDARVHECHLIFLQIDAFQAA